MTIIPGGNKTVLWVVMFYSCGLCAGTSATSWTTEGRGPLNSIGRKKNPTTRNWWIKIQQIDVVPGGIPSWCQIWSWWQVTEPTSGDGCFEKWLHVCYVCLVRSFGDTYIAEIWFFGLPNDREVFCSPQNRVNPSLRSGRFFMFFQWIFAFRISCKNGVLRVVSVYPIARSPGRSEFLLGTWVKSSFVVRSRPFVVSTMGSVTAEHYDISCYACYHKLILHETHRDTVMLMFVAPDLYQENDMSAVSAGVLPQKPLILLFPEAFWLGVRTLSCKIVIEEWLLWKWCPHCVLLSKGWLFAWGVTSHICSVTMRGCDFTRQGVT